MSPFTSLGFGEEFSAEKPTMSCRSMTADGPHRPEAREADERVQSDCSQTNRQSVCRRLLTCIAAWAFMSEAVGWQRAVGMLLIGIGIVLVK
jgi:hypothetical protein